MGEVVALLQLNPTVGDIESNVAEIERAAALAASNGASVAWTCELAVCGYPPRDLLLEDGFVFNIGADDVDGGDSFERLFLCEGKVGVVDKEAELALAQEA